MGRIILLIMMFAMMMFCSRHSFAQFKDEPAKKVYAIYTS